jgi:hypothetical protein
MPLPDEDALHQRMRKLRLREEDLQESFIRGSGPGGQKVNKTSSTVVLRHVPSGLEVRCQRERSQVLNRHWARVELCDRVEAARQEARLAEQNEREKTRRQNRPRPRGLKQRIHVRDTIAPALSYVESVTLHDVLLTDTRVYVLATVKQTLPSPPIPPAPTWARPTSSAARG